MASEQTENSDSESLDESHWNQWVMKCHQMLYQTSQGSPTFLQSQCINKCSNINQCLAFRRLLYIMQFYQQFQHSSDGIHLLIECLSHNTTQNYYNLATLLNDHHHILQFHKNDTNDYALIVYELNKYYKCDINKCAVMKRNIDRENIDYDAHPLYKLFDDEQYDIAVIQMLDKIHCSLYHAYDFYKMNEEQIANMDKILKDNANDKDLFQRSYYLQLNDMMKEKYTTFVQVKGENAVKKSIKYSTIAVPQRYAEISQDDEKILYDSDNEEIKVEHRGKSKYESIGFRYYYDDKRRNAADTKHATFIRKKYSNLQRELTNNNFCAIDLDEWNQQIFTANIYLDTCYARRHGLDVQHILSIIFYCNLEALQRAFQNSTVLISKQDNYELASQRHREFANWARILNETVDTFGMRCDHSDASARTFYQCLIEPNEATKATLDFDFNESFARFYCPTFMTASVGAMMLYSRDKYGIMLSLCTTPISIGQRYLDCGWLSCFESEESYLFTHNTKYIMKANVLQINDLIDTTNNVNYGYYMKGISILNHIIHNENIFIQTTKSMFDALGKLISHRLRPISYTNHEDAYIDAIFARFCQIQSGYITIDMNKLTLLCSTNENTNVFLRNYLISETQNKDVFVLKCHNFVELFHHTPSIEIRNCCLNSIMFELICQSLKLQEHRTDLQLIEFCNINEEASELSNHEIVAKYEAKLDQVAWSITVTGFDDIRVEKLKFILMNPKCKLYVNIFNAAFYIGNARRKTVADDYGQVNEEEEKTTHGVYQIKVEHNAMNKKNKTWMVDKRYSDFLKLHKWILKKRDAISPLNVPIKFPPKTLFRKPNTSNVMEERRGKFEQYLRYLLIAAHKHENKMYLKKLSHFLSPDGYLSDDTDNGW